MDGSTIVYNFASSPNHIVVNITPSKLANVIDFKAHFPVVSMNFRILVYFKSWLNRVRYCTGGWTCIDGFGDDFRVPWSCMKQRSVWWRFCALKKWQKRFVCSTKIFYYKCRRSGYFGYIENFSCEHAVLMWTTEETAIASSTYDEIRENSKTAHERLYWFTEGIFTRSNTTQKNMYYKYMVWGGGEGGEGGGGGCSSPQTLRSYVLASFPQITCTFGSIQI